MNLLDIILLVIQYVQKEKRYLDESIFMKHNEEDIFSLSKEPEMVEGNVSITKLFEKAVKTVKKLIS